MTFATQISPLLNFTPNRFLWKSSNICSSSSGVSPTQKQIFSTEMKSHRRHLPKKWKNKMNWITQKTVWRHPLIRISTRLYNVAVIRSQIRGTTAAAAASWQTITTFKITAAVLKIVFRYNFFIQAVFKVLIKPELFCQYLNFKLLKKIKNVGGDKIVCSNKFLTSFI